MIGTMALKETF